MHLISILKDRIRSKIIRTYYKPVIVPLIDGEYLKGKSALIIGGNGGIGYSIAERFISNGAQVILSGTNENKLRENAQKLGNNTKYVVINIKDVENVHKGIDKVFSINPSVDILVNAAGVHGSSDFWSVDEKSWDQVMDINVKGLFFSAQLFSKYLINHKMKGHILIISSASDLKPGRTPYEISKNAVRSFVRGLAAECVKYGIVVNCISPGPTATNMINRGDADNLEWIGNPSGRLAKPEEIANWAVLLASDFGDYIIGDSIYVTGGSGTICIDR